MIDENPAAGCILMVVMAAIAVVVAWALHTSVQRGEACHNAGGTYLLREGKCIEVRTIYPRSE